MQLKLLATKALIGIRAEAATKNPIHCVKANRASENYYCYKFFSKQI